MPTPADVIAYLAHAGLSPAEVMQSVYYLRNGQAPPGAVLSEKAQQTIGYLGAAGLDDAGVRRADAYLATGQDPGGPDPTPAPAPAPAPAPPKPPSLGEDPAYLAYKRALGAEEAADTEATTHRTEALQRQLGDQLANLGITGERQRQDISGNFEARGVLRSGAHEVRLGEQRQDEGSQAGQLQASTASQVGDLQEQLAQRRLSNQRRLAETGLQSASSLYTS